MPLSFSQESTKFLNHLFPHNKRIGSTSIYQITENIFIQLISINNTVNFDNKEFEHLANEYDTVNQQIIHLWEDLWHSHQDIIKSRLTSVAGITNKIHGRKTKVVRIHQEQFYDFLNKNHLQGAVHAKYKLGLFEKDKLVAVAGFSHPRKIPRDGEISRSSELIRFCNLTHHTVIGGMDKLLKHFTSNFEVDDIMSYADRDWSNGKSYKRLGFDFIERTAPTTFWVNLKNNQRYFEHHLAKQFGLEEQQLTQYLKQNDYLRIANSGNLKFIKPVPIT